VEEMRMMDRELSGAASGLAVSGAGRRRGLRRGALLLVAGGALSLTGCATKKDLRDLRYEIMEMQVRQDSLFNEFGAAVMDTLQSSHQLMLRIRGDLGNQLLAMEQQLIQIQELTGQGQRQLNDLRQQWLARTQVTDEVPAPEGAVATTMGEGEVEQTYGLGRQKLQEGAITTARSAFASIRSGAPTHPLAPEAQIQIAETYVAEKNFERAYQEFERVIELFANSPQAPTALYRAGLLAKEEGKTSKARTYFSRVQSGYARSDEAKLAGEELRRLRPR
jgi:TolA-binding protein